MKIIIWIIVAIVVIGGLAWFMSSDSIQDSTNNTGNTGSQEIIESGSINSNDQVFNEIDNALSSLG
jgi:hypothetical protein